MAPLLGLKPKHEAAGPGKIRPDIAWPTPCIADEKMMGV